MPLSKPLSMPSDNLKPRDLDDLQKKILALEQQLQDERLRSEVYLRIIEKAEQELKIPIKKKHSTK